MKNFDCYIPEEQYKQLGDTFTFIYLHNTSPLNFDTSTQLVILNEEDFEAVVELKQLIQEATTTEEVKEYASLIKELNPVGFTFIELEYKRSCRFKSLTGQEINSCLSFSSTEGAARLLDPALSLNEEGRPKTISGRRSDVLVDVFCFKLNRNPLKELESYKTAAKN